MTDQTPETGEAMDLEIGFEPSDEGLDITLELEDARITVFHTWENPQAAALLVQALPQALMKVQEVLNEQESQ